MKLAIIFLGFMVAFGNANKCGIAPRFWCDSEEIAMHCGVLEACSTRLNPSAFAETADPVRVEVYFESYCPDSIRFITTMLYPTWNTLESTGIVTVIIVPFGKARYWKQNDGSWRYVCQHGPDECVGNTIENCIIHYSNNEVAKYLPIVDCMELASDPVTAAKQCTTDGGLDWSEVSVCANGSEGNSLLHDAGVATKALNPVLNWVPWIVINGVHTNDIQTAATTDLLSLICETYQGEQPAACKSASTKIRFAPQHKNHE